MDHLPAVFSADAADRLRLCACAGTVRECAGSDRRACSNDAAHPSLSSDSFRRPAGRSRQLASDALASWCFDSLRRDSLLHCFHNGAPSSKLVVQNADGIGKRSVLLVCRKQCRKFAGFARLSVAHRTTLGRAAPKFVLVRGIYGFSASVIWRRDRSLETRLPESIGDGRANRTCARSSGVTANVVAAAFLAGGCFCTVGADARSNQPHAAEPGVGALSVGHAACDLSRYLHDRVCAAASDFAADFIRYGSACIIASLSPCRGLPTRRRPIVEMGARIASACTVRRRPPLPYHACVAATARNSIDGILFLGCAWWRARWRVCRRDCAIRVQYGHRVSPARRPDRVLP